VPLPGAAGKLARVNLTAVPFKVAFFINENLVINGTPELQAKFTLRVLAEKEVGAFGGVAKTMRLDVRDPNCLQYPQFEKKT